MKAVFKSERHDALEAAYPRRRPVLQEKAGRHVRGRFHVGQHVRMRFVVWLVAAVAFWWVAR